MNSLTARFSVNRAWCFVVGREYDVVRHAARVGKKSGDKAGKQRAFTTTPTRQRVRNDEDAVSFEIGLIMGGAMGLGMSLYFLDPKTPIKTGEHSIIRAIWPTMADALEKSVLESEKPEKVIERIESSYGITPQRAAYISLMSFMMFRTSRRYWSRRWGDLEWQRSVVFMPWATTVGMGMYMPIFISLPCFALGYSSLHSEALKKWASHFPFSLTIMRQQAMSAVWILMQTWAVTVFAMMYAVGPCTMAGARTAVWWATRRVAGV